jgi:hypothetical protein
MAANGERDGGFLARWARLKAQSRARPEEAEAAPPVTPSAGEEASPPPQAAPRADAQELREELPEDLAGIDPDALDPQTTDFSRFLKEDVPEWLRRKALRKLWQSDPALANLDGLNDYDEDFTEGGIAAAAQAFFQRLRDVGEAMDEAGKEPSEERRAPAPARTAETAPPEASEEEPAENPDPEPET